MKRSFLTGVVALKSFSNLCVFDNNEILDALNIFHAIKIKLILV